MGLRQKLTDDRRRKLEEFMSAHLQPGETIQATLPMSQTHTDPSLGMALNAYFGMVLTDRHLYIVNWATSLPERPTDVAAALPRSSVAVAKWKRGFTAGTLGLAVSGGDDIELKVPGLNRDDAETLISALA